MDDSFRIGKGLYLLFLLCLSGVVGVSIRYSLPEEKKSGSLVANVLKDLKLGPGELSARRAQQVSKSNKHYFQLDTRSGNVIVNERIDREALCGKMDSCLLLAEIVLQNPLKIHNIEIQIEDVNDNSPKFSKKEFEMAVPENVPTNTRFPLESAQDTDLGENSIQNYTLSPNGNFGLDMPWQWLLTWAEGAEYPGDLLTCAWISQRGAPVASFVSINSETGNLYVLRSLDYEQLKEFQVTVRASDGGSPPLSSEVVVRVVVLDENDNAPFFLYPLQNSTSPCTDTDI
uniref:Uncharacterized protein n=1 Tax=Sphaerodactylus townsendi TaxID=933632 RepID=A0ACB8EC38_9SAUR